MFYPAGGPPAAGEAAAPPSPRRCRRIADEGPDGFYKGPSPSDRRQRPACGRQVTTDDLNGYGAVERAPVHGTYRG